MKKKSFFYLGIIIIFHSFTVTNACENEAVDICLVNKDSKNDIRMKIWDFKQEKLLKDVVISKLQGSYSKLKSSMCGLEECRVDVCYAAKVKLPVATMLAISVYKVQSAEPDTYLGHSILYDDAEHIREIIFEGGYFNLAIPGRGYYGFASLDKSVLKFDH